MAPRSIWRGSHFDCPSSSHRPSVSGMSVPVLPVLLRLLPAAAASDHWTVDRPYRTSAPRLVLPRMASMHHSSGMASSPLFFLMCLYSSLDGVPCGRLTFQSVSSTANPTPKQTELGEGNDRLGRHVGAELFRFGVLGGNLSNAQEG